MCRRHFFSEIKILAGVLIFLGTSFNVFSQDAATPTVLRPMVIESVDRVSGAAGDRIFISGRRFPDNSNLAVFLGGIKAEAVAVSGRESFLIDVTIPAYSSYDNIIVLDKGAGLSVSSSDFLGLNFGGVADFDKDSFEEIVRFQFDAPSYAVYDLAVCDFNSDGLLDVVFSHDSTNDDEPGTEITHVSIMINQVEAVTGKGEPLQGYELEDHDGDPDTPERPIKASFRAFKLKLEDHTVNIACGDLNGDGKPDIVASQAVEPFGGDSGGGVANALYVAINTTPDGTPPDGNLTFEYDASETSHRFQLPESDKVARDGNPIQRHSRKIALRDVDGDGKVDIIVNNETDSSIFIYRNGSTSGSSGYRLMGVTFQADLIGGSALRGLEARDLNGDGLPEIIAAQNGAEGVFIRTNTSKPGRIDFDNVVKTLRVEAAALRTLTVGDINNDGKPDILLTGSREIYIFKNTSEFGTLSFDEEPFRSGVLSERDKNARIWGISLGDLNGDGRQDIAVGHHKDNEDKGIYVFLNRTEEGTEADIDFEEIDTEQNYSALNVKIADVNGDGRPDIIFAHQQGKMGEMGVLINKHCVKPVISPGNDDTDEALKVCGGFPFNLHATLSPTGSYQWKNGGKDISGATNPTFDVDAENLTADTYTITVSLSVGSCEETSDGVKIEKLGDAARSVLPRIGQTHFCLYESDPKIFNTTVLLDAHGVPIPDTDLIWSWTGPAGFSSNQKEPNLKDHRIAGRYTCFYSIGDCRGPEKDDIDVSFESLPLVRVELSDDSSPYVCTGEEVSHALGISSEEDIEEDIDGNPFSFQWRLDG
ncbi:MAG: VCBS repeat-containing protein, partial [Cytophagales bacterium]|nr:VCBS repeat-containing protein [Cytophagales bacterium]